MNPPASAAIADKLSQSQILRDYKRAFAEATGAEVARIDAADGAAALTGPIARGDELSDAIARQKALAARVRDQRAAVARLQALQGGLAKDISASQA